MGHGYSAVSDRVLSNIQFQRQRQKDDSLPRYFHGSTHIFGAGSTLDPTPDRIYGGEDKAYATGPDAPRGYKSAADYAYMRAVPSRITEPHQGQLFAAVHEVSPRSEVKNPSGALNQIASAEPMDVHGVAGWVRTDDLGRELSLGDQHDL
jgi:hypothetical protein